jgi:hypothetical protein
MPGDRGVSFVPQLVLGLVATATLFIAFTLPPRAAQLPSGPITPPVVYGGYHIHSNRSDGTGTPDEIAAAAARAGLNFIILTDHADATRPPDPPQYRHGVLCVDAAEIATAAGHVVALGLTGPAPYPLAGEARDVIEDIHRMGGWAVIAHPDSPKPDLRWRSANVEYDGLEWLNIDSEWRDESPLHVAGTIARYFVRPSETIASLFQRPAATLRRWDLAGRGRPIVGLAALDAHARVPWRGSYASDGTLAARPTYEQMFRTVVQGVIVAHPLSGEAGPDAALVMAALRSGHTFSVISAIAHPASLSFTATKDAVSAAMGESLDAVGDAVTFRAALPQSPAARLVLVHNGVVAAEGRGHLELSAPASRGPYRVEAYYPGNVMPWVTSNPIYIGLPVPPPDTTGPDQALAPPRLVPLPGAGSWTIERDPRSTGNVGADAQSWHFNFALAPGSPSGQYAALVTAVDPSLKDEGFDRVRFTIRARHPMRVSVQLRLPHGAEDQRWRQSVYADETARPVVLSLQDFLPADRATSQRPIVAHVRSVLFVVDTINTSPGTAGTFWVSDVALGVGETGK